MLEFLPEKVFIPQAFDFNKLIIDLYNVFERDIKFGDLKYKGWPVIFDNRLVESCFEEGFWHLVERGKQSRTLDIKRAKRLPWIKPLIENSDDPRLFKWIEERIGGRGSREEVTYILYKEEHYLVVLKKRRNKYFLATAFYLVGFNREKYLRKYNQALKKGPGC